MKTKINYKAIEKYIFDCINFSDYQNKPEKNSEKIAYLLEVCEREKFYNKYPTKKAMFVDWLYGLPSCFNVDYQQYKVIELCKNFGLKTPKHEYQLFDFWYGQIYDSVNYLNKKLNK